MISRAIFQFLGMWCLLMAVAFSIWYIPRSSIFPRASFGAILHEETSEYSKIRVRGDDQKRHLLFVSDAGVEQLQSTIDLANPGQLQVAYTKTLFASLLFKQRQERVLLIGLGGGGMVRFVEENLPETSIEVVEIDPAVVRLADEYFETRDGIRVEIHTEDAFDFVARRHEPFDAIYLDAFLRPSVDHDPGGKTARLKTVEFLKKIKNHLVGDGILACNLISYRKTTPGDLEALREVFVTVEQYDVPGSGNMVVIASKGEVMRTEEEWLRVAERLESRIPDLAFQKFVADQYR